MELVYKHEKPLFWTLLIISLIVWAGVLVGTRGLALVYLLFFFVFYCFAQSALISYLRGTGVRITSEQFPDLKEKIDACCTKLGLEEVPDAYLLHMGGVFNAFATRFLGRNFIVLYSDIVDALEEHPDALNFYIGHEVGHIKRRHIQWATVLMPASFLPLIGAAYSRAREYTCDRHGFHACTDLNSAQFGLAALAAGGKRWRTMSKSQYAAQASESRGFWMSFHEIVADYPWLVKRMSALKALAQGNEVQQPSRNPLAYIFALFVPRVGTGGGGGVIVTVAIIGILAAVALPAYNDYTSKAKLSQSFLEGRQTAAAVSEYYRNNGANPESLEQAGASSHPISPAVKEIQFDSGSDIIRIVPEISSLRDGALVFLPSIDDENKEISWRCSGENIPEKLLPQGCR